MCLAAVTNSVQQVELFDQISMINQKESVLNRCVTLVGGAIIRFPSMLELREESLMSDATLAESESRSSHDSALLEGREDGLRRQAPTA